MVVYSLSLSYYDALAFSDRQAGDIWLTAAQSFFAVALLVNFEISVREAFALLALFAAQFYPTFQSYGGLLAYSGPYVVLGVGVLVARRRHLPAVVSSARGYVGGADSEPGVSD